jgi:hypothetical protein
MNARDGAFFTGGLVFPLKDENDTIIGFLKMCVMTLPRKTSRRHIKKYAKELEVCTHKEESVLAILSHDFEKSTGRNYSGSSIFRKNFEKNRSVVASRIAERFHLAAVNRLNMLDYLNGPE